MIRPGKRLALGKPEREFEFDRLLGLLEGHFVDASLAGNMFV